MKLRTTFRDPWIVVWSAITGLLIVTCTALGVGLFATSHADSVANCVNAILGVRAPLTEADHANERQKIADQTVATRDESAGLKTALNPANTQPEQLAGVRLYQHGVAEFQKALDNWKTRDDAIAAEKRQHPLGKC